MLIVKYESESEAQQITNEKTAQGFVLTHVSNVKEGNFLGFMDSSPVEVDNTPSVLLEIRNNTDILLLKQEGII